MIAMNRKKAIILREIRYLLFIYTNVRPVQAHKVKADYLMWERNKGKNLQKFMELCKKDNG